MKVAVVGGGINGICSAWQLALAGYDVELFEKGSLLGETSSSSSKLLHGGLRYLENLDISLVRKALIERNWWIKNVPKYAKPIQLCFPIYTEGRRSALKLRLGLCVYDWLAGPENIGCHQVILKDEMLRLFPQLKHNGLRKSFVFYDGQMDELGLGLWVVSAARKAGAILNECSFVEAVNDNGSLIVNGHNMIFDVVVNVTGPWAGVLNTKNNIPSRYTLDLVRGSHIILNRQLGNTGFLLEVAEERRVFFVLPYQGNTLVGTTEKRQGIDEPIVCDQSEVDYLLAAYNYYFVEKVDEQNIIEIFSGLRPLISSSTDPNKSTRDYAIERVNRLVTVFGGKWTTARALGISVVKEIEGIHGIH